MIKTRRLRLRRSLAAVLVIVGGLLMLLAPGAWPGAVLMVVGILVEVVGITLERKDGK